MLAAAAFTKACGVGLASSKTCALIDWVVIGGIRGSGAKDLGASAICCFKKSLGRLVPTQGLGHAVDAATRL